MSKPFVMLFPRTVTRNMFAVPNSIAKGNVRDVTNAITFAKALFHLITHAQKQRKLLMFATDVQRRVAVVLISTIIVPQELTKNTKLFLLSPEQALMLPKKKSKLLMISLVLWLKMVSPYTPWKAIHNTHQR